MMRLRLALLLLALLPRASALADDVPLGRLFFTPAERVTLEESRRRAQAPKASEAERKVGVIKPHATVRFSGMVKRSDGVSAIWVNGKYYYGRERPEDIGLVSRASNDAISVKLPESGKRVPLRVGQDMDATSGIVAERYSLREIAEPVSATEKKSGVRTRQGKSKAAQDKSAGALPKDQDEGEEAALAPDGR